MKTEKQISEQKEQYKKIISVYLDRLSIEQLEQTLDSLTLLHGTQLHKVFNTSIE